MKFVNTLLFTALTVAIAGAAHAAVSPDEAAKLGSSLTAVGAEKAGNADNTIPAYTGGITTPPASFQTGSSFRPDPYEADKPRAVIDGKNVGQFAGKLTATTQELLKRYPTFRVDVFPTHRSVALPQRLLDNTAKNAVGTKTLEGGVALENALPGVPFPIPKDGYEAMWNHLLRYQGYATNFKYDSWNVDGSGSAIRRGWQYLPGQRRVKLAPDIAYDTPNPGSAGASTYDDAWVFNGAMDRYDFKLVGKKEMIIPYNTYKLNYHKEAADITTPHFVNPDLMRWELHRVWVVEATLKPGKRHIYSKRTFYLDEDSWIALASDEYDASGKLYRGSFAHLAYSYDVQAPNSDNHMIYDFVSGSYNITGIYGPYGGVKYIDPLSKALWAPESLAGTGIR